MEEPALALIARPALTLVARPRLGGQHHPQPEIETEPPPPVGLAPTLESRIFCIRNNDPDTTHLHIGSVIEPKAWKQLGSWLQKNTHVTSVCFLSCHVKGKSMEDLCKGLQHNESIREFELCENRLKNKDVENLALFITKTPHLHTLNIENCHMGASSNGMELFSSALMGRTQSIQNVSLDGNCMGGEGIDKFDSLITAFNKNTELRRLSLMGNQIGKQACTSLARLLKNPDTKVKSLILRHNCIDDKCAGILAEALTSNTMTTNIDLDKNEQISAKGLMKFLNLVSRTSGSTINLTLHWTGPESTDEVPDETLFRVKIKLNEPLKKLAAELCTHQQFSWVDDMSRQLRFTLGRRHLDIKETPFFYGMKDGGSIKVTKEDPKWGSALPKEVEEGVPMLLDEDDCFESNDIRHTCASNHSLTSVGYETALRRGFVHGKLFREYLEANRRGEITAQRVKIFRSHIEYHLSLEAFCELDLVMPQVLAWIGTALSEDDDNRTYLSTFPPPIVRFDATYRIFRAMPYLCSYR